MTKSYALQNSSKKNIKKKNLATIAEKNKIKTPIP